MILKDLAYIFYRQVLAIGQDGGMVRMKRTSTGIAALANAGDPAFIRFREQDVVVEIAAARGWVLRHVNEIEAALLE